MAQFLQLLKSAPQLAVAATLAFAASASHADPLNTVIAPQLGAIAMNETRQSSPNSTTTIDGYRYSFRIDFMSLSNNVSINATAATGGKYNDYGLQFRIFDLLQLGQQSSSGVYYGAGLGFAYSPGYEIADITDKASFLDVIATAFLRFQWDTSSSWGIFTELAYEGAIQRILNTEPRIKNEGTSHRFAMSVGLPFEVDL
jgi:hypothetical protein